jgi:hypothetical protein
MFKLAFADLDRHPFGRPITARTFWRLNLLIVILLAILALLIMSIAPARAAQCNTIFLTDKNGNVSFPLCPPNRANSTPGFIDNMTIGSSVPAAGNFTTTTVQTGTPATLNATGTLTAAQLATTIVTSTSAAAVTATLPLATAMDTANPSAVATTSFTFSVIDTGPSTVTVTTNTGWTLVGTMAVTTGTSGRFLAVKTGTGAWTLYRLS